MKHARLKYIQHNFFFPLAATNYLFASCRRRWSWRVLRNTSLILELSPIRYSSWLRIFFWWWWFCSWSCSVLFFNPWSWDISDSLSALLHATMSYMIRAHLFGCLHLNPLGDTARAHTCWSLLHFQTRRKPLSYPNTFLFVWLTCKECALLSVFGKQNRDWTLKLSLHLKWALNTDFTMCSFC